MHEYISWPFTDPYDKKLYDHHGFWLVEGDKAFKNKNTALAYCKNKGTKHIKYCLSDDVFDNQNWQHEPDISLKDLYKIRAQQIRDSYDYVVLTYSGGSDSSNILHSFVENNIMPDEVISYMCVGKDFTTSNIRLNIEIEKNKAYIREYALSKGIPFNVMDISGYYDYLFDQPDWMFRMHNNRAYINARAYTNLDNRFKRLTDSGKKCCVVHGLEKPNVIYENDGFYAYFLDNPLMQYTNNLVYDKDYNGLYNERFYVTEDLPELTIKQSHVVANYLAQKSIASIAKRFTNNHEGGYNEMVIDLLYAHSFDRTKAFTLGKNPYIWGYRDDWVLNLPNGELRKQYIENAYNYLCSKLDVSQFNKNNWVFDTVGCIGKKHLLKKIQ